MSNRKSGLPLGGIFGFMLVATVLFIMLIFFSSCTASRQVKKFTQFEYSKESFFLAKELNIFLNIQYDEDKKVSDILIEHMAEFFIDETTGVLDTQIDLAEQEKFKKKMDDLVLSKVPVGRRFILVQPGGSIIYDNFNKPQFRQISYEATAESIATLPAPVGLNNFVFVQAFLQQ